MACSASSGVAISTNPKPRDRPVSRSVTTLADSTLPTAAKASRRRSLDVEKDKPPTKSFTAMEGLLLTAQDYRSIHCGHDSGNRILPEVRPGRLTHRAAWLRRPVPRPLPRRSGRSDPRRAADHHRRGPLTSAGSPVVDRAARVLRRSARGRRRPLLGRAPLGGAGHRLASRPLGTEPGSRGAAQGRVPEPWRQDRLHGATRDGPESRGLPDGGDRPRSLLEVPGGRCRSRSRKCSVRVLPRLPLCGPGRTGVRRRAPRGALGGPRRPRHRRGVGHARGAAPRPAALIGPNAIVGVEMTVIAVERKPWHASFRLLERDDRVFAVLLAVVMVGGLVALGFFPLARRYRDIDLYWLVFCFAAYKVGIFALVTVNPRATRAYFIGALAIDLLLVFVLLCLTGAGDSVYYLLFFPLVAVNAYYLGPWVGLGAAVVAGGLYAWSAALAGLPAVTLGLVADRERRARGEIERLNDEVTGTLSRLQTAQQDLVVAERMATVGRLSLRIAHEVRNPITAIELNAEMLEDIVRERTDPDMKEAAGLVSAIREQVTALDALTEEYLAFARFPRPHFEEESINHLVQELADFVRPVATRQGLTLRVEVDPNVPMMEIDRGLLRQAVWNLVKNGLEALSSGGELTIASRFDGERVEIAVSDTGGGISEDIVPRLFEQFFTTKPQGTGLGLSITRQIAEEHGGEVSWTNRAPLGATFTIRLPIKRVTDG